MALLEKILKLADRATQSWSTRAGANLLFLKGYGKMTHLKIDRENKSLQMELQLLGESEPVHISIGGYAFEKLPDGSARITLTNLQVSRQWMQQAANQFIEGKPLPIPADMAGYLALLI